MSQLLIIDKHTHSSNTSQVLDDLPIYGPEYVLKLLRKIYIQITANHVFKL
jgi:hypothetical protein